MAGHCEQSALAVRVWSAVCGGTDHRIPIHGLLLSALCSAQVQPSLNYRWFSDLSLNSVDLSVAV